MFSKTPGRGELKGNEELTTAMESDIELKYCFV